MADSDCIIVHEQVVVPEAAVVEEMVALPGEKGDKGDPFTYDDFTPEQIADLQRPATEAAAVANQAAENANKATSDIKVLSDRLTAEEAKRESAESGRASAESERAEAEALRESSFSQMQTTLEGLITDTRTATSNANTAAGNAENAATAANNSATLANAAADKANQAAESIAYKENGFYISHAFLEATDLRYIGFKEIKNDKTCYLLTMGRCLKFSLDTYEVFWDIKLEGYGVSWHDAAEQLRVIDDTVYIICCKWGDNNNGIWLIRLNEEDGAFISEELIPIPVQYVYNTFIKKNVLITKDAIAGFDYVNKRFLKCNIADKSIEIIGTALVALDNRWLKLPNGDIKYCVSYLEANNLIKVITEDFEIYTFELSFSNSENFEQYYSILCNINFENKYISFLKDETRVYNTVLEEVSNNHFFAKYNNPSKDNKPLKSLYEFYNNSLVIQYMNNSLSSTGLTFPSLQVSIPAYYPARSFFMSNMNNGLSLIPYNLSTSATGLKTEIIKRYFS